MNDQAEVLCVFDAHDRSGYIHRGWPPLMDWIREHGAEPNRVVRIEVLLLDCPFVRFYEFDVDDNGRVKVKPGTPDSSSGPWPRTWTTPRDVLLRRMPPERQAVG